MKDSGNVFVYLVNTWHVLLCGREQQWKLFGKNIPAVYMYEPQNVVAIVTCALYVRTVHCT